MKRRELVSSAAAAGVAGILPRHSRAGAEPSVAAPQVPGSQPNILIIIVDQMRYPRVLPSGINDVGTFLSRIMPNVHTLWKHGVKFTNHFTAAVACTPSRGTLLTGLYSHQTWLLETIVDRPYHASSKQPWLQPSFPTYGKLLPESGISDALYRKVACLHPFEARASARRLWLRRTHVLRSDWFSPPGNGWRPRAWVSERSGYR
jgi:arylsulfatase A-like enzyme